MIQFHKYVATGNDFVIFDNWNNELDLSVDQIVALCDRRFGIGADGVLLLNADPEADFRMIYFNADGSRGEMCGNGARSLVKFAAALGKVGLSGQFIADDGAHKYNIIDDQVEVEILVNDQLHAWDIPRPGTGFINTGVPHLIIPTKNTAKEKLNLLGESMNAHVAHPQGTNVNIVEKTRDKLIVRTWERGVNMETLACGTGAAAVAIYANETWDLTWPVLLSFKGGDLKVNFHGNQYWLSGAAQLVFEGHIALS